MVHASVSDVKSSKVRSTSSALFPYLCPSGIDWTRYLDYPPRRQPRMVASPYRPLAAACVEHGTIQCATDTYPARIWLRVSRTIPVNLRASSPIHASCRRARASLGINSAPMPRAVAPAKMKLAAVC
jgi:hypothetical protein